MKSSAMAIGVGLLLGGCTVGSDADVPRPGAQVSADPGCGTYVVDGLFSGAREEQICPDEWADVTPLRGRFGDLYVDVDDESNLIVLNDWHLRDDAPASPEMYNLFCLATDIGVFTALAGGGTGTSWSRYGSGLPTSSVNDLAVSPAGDYVMAATHGRGLWTQLLP